MIQNIGWTSDEIGSYTYDIMTYYQMYFSEFSENPSNGVLYLIALCNNHCFYQKLY